MVLEFKTNHNPLTHTLQKVCLRGVLLESCPS